jgi:hypothetical protein
MKLNWGLLSKRVLVSVLFLVATVAVAFQGQSAYASQITTRSLTLQAGASDGGSKPGGVVKHQFAFILPTAGTVGSIQFLYCTTASGTCTTPTGLVTTTATLGTSTGAAFTTNGAPYVSRVAASVTAGQSVVTQLLTITNPTTTNQTFFVRISSFAATNATGSAVDTGTVAASTATQIVLTGTMPESLIFCAGATVSTTLGIPDCTTATAGAVSFNQLFSPTDTATATSQMAASTNASSGYVITVNGPTLTSGGNFIPAMASSTTGVRGTGQFGMNLKLNTVATSTTAVGTEIASPSDNVNLKGQALIGYNTVDNFKFVSGDSVANSGYSASLGPTNSQIYTASYIVNVAGNQASGTYISTLTYICTATF